MKILRILEANPDYDNNEMDVYQKQKHLERKRDGIQEEQKVLTGNIQKLVRSNLLILFNDVPKNAIKDYAAFPLSQLSPFGALYVNRSNTKVFDYVHALNERNIKLLQLLQKTEASITAARGQITKYENKARLDPGKAKDNGRWALEYARVQGKPFPEGEDAIIAEGAYWIFTYANEVLHGRFLKGEATIAQDPYHAFSYANNIIKGPFPEGEDAIATNSNYSLAYAKEVLHGRFLKGEAEIASDGYCSVGYAEQILHARFIPGEKAIKRLVDTGDTFALNYQNKFNVKL